MGSTGNARAARWLRAFAIVATVVGLLAQASGVAVGADATVRGGCTATGTSSSGGVIDLTTNAVWHVRSTDSIALAGSGISPQTHVTVNASAFGFAIPIGGGNADPSTSASSDTFDVATLALLGRVFLISGSSTGADSGCSGEVEVIIDDANPILTVFGGGGIAGFLIGTLGLWWAVRRPTGLRRRLVGLVSLALMGIGGSLLLQQVAPPGDPASFIGESPFVASVLSPTQLLIDQTILLQAAILTALVLLLLPFPSQLFNSTLEENYDSIRADFARVPLLGRLIRSSTDSAGVQAVPDAPPSDPASAVIWRWLVVIVFVLVSGLLYGLLDPTFGLDTRSLVTYVGIVVALVVVTWAAALPKRAIYRQLVGDRGRVSVLAGTLVVAAFCVLISRLVGFLPGYLYGLVLGYAFIKDVEPAEDGRAGALGAWWMLAVSFIAWLTLGAVRTPGVADTVPATIAASALAALTVAGIEGIVFGLVPLRFLPGELVYRHRRSRWYPTYALGVFGFVMILLNPATGYVPSQGSVPFVMAVALFVGFGLASVLFWGWFRFRGEDRMTADEA